MASTAAASAAASPDDDAPSRVWIPQLVERFASLLSPNEVACSLRLVDKATAALRTNKSPQCSTTTTVRLSQPVPHHAFTRRWADPRALRPLTWRRRRQLLQLTARSGALANLEALLALEDYCPLKSDILEAAAGAGQLTVCQALRRWGCPWGDATLHEAARGGHRGVCEWLLASSYPWSDKAPGEAAAGGHTELMHWLLEEAAAAAPTPAGGARVDAGALFRGAASGCDLATLRHLYDSHATTLLGGAEDGVDVAFLIPAAITSPTPDWQAKAEWLLAAGASDVHTHNGRGRHERQIAVDPRVGGCVELYEREDWRPRLEWVRRRCGSGGGSGLGGGEEAVWAAVLAGNAAAVDSLLPQPNGGGLGMPPWVTVIAAERRHLRVLEVLVGRGFPVHEMALQGALRAGDLALVRWVAARLRLGPGTVPGQQRMSGDLFTAGASSGSLEVMEWLLERGCPWGPHTFAAAAAAGGEKQLEWLAERGSPQGDDGAPYIQPAARGDLSTLRCLRRLGCPWSGADDTDTAGGDTFACCAAAVGDDPVERRCDRPMGLAWLLGQGCRVGNWRQLSNVLSREAVQWLRESRGGEGTQLYGSAFDATARRA